MIQYDDELFEPKSDGLHQTLEHILAGRTPEEKAKILYLIEHFHLTPDDPVLLMFLANSEVATVITKGPEQIHQAIAEGVAQLQDVLKTQQKEAIQETRVELNHKSLWRIRRLFLVPFAATVTGAFLAGLLGGWFIPRLDLLTQAAQTQISQDISEQFGGNNRLELAKQLINLSDNADRLSQCHQEEQEQCTIWIQLPKAQQNPETSQPELQATDRPLEQTAQ